MEISKDACMDVISMNSNRLNIFLVTADACHEKKQLWKNLTAIEHINNKRTHSHHVLSSVDVKFLYNVLLWEAPTIYI